MEFKHGKTTQKFNVNNKGCRTQAQYEAFIQYFKTHEHLYLCINPFKVDYPGESYNCTFTVNYVDKLNNLKTINITPTGKIKSIQ